MHSPKPFLGMFQSSWQAAFQRADILASTSQALQGFSLGKSSNPALPSIDQEEKKSEFLGFSY